MADSSTFCKNPASPCTTYFSVLSVRMFCCRAAGIREPAVHAAQRLYLFVSPGAQPKRSSIYSLENAAANFGNTPPKGDSQVSRVFQRDKNWWIDFKDARGLRLPKKTGRPKATA